MKYRIPNKCPVCKKQNITVKEVKCDFCNTIISGSFRSCEFCNLSEENFEFIIVFIKSQGNIKEVEKKLGISYPTVKNKLSKIILQLENRESQERLIQKMKEKILNDLNSGIISAKEAAELLK